MSEALTTHERLDRIDEQIQQVAEVIHEALEKIMASEMGTAEAKAFTESAEVLIRLFELEADVIRRRPR